MDGMTRADLQGVVAPLNFMAPMAEKPYSYNYDPPPGVPAPQRAIDRTQCHRPRCAPGQRRAVARPRGLRSAAPPDRGGRSLRRDDHPSVYYPECERLMQEATGARRVVAFDHIVRNAAKAAVKGSGIKMPAGRVHNDYTAWSAPQRVRDLMGDEAEELLKHRFAINNVWRPIAGPLLRSPLALCDAETLEAENLVASELRYPDRTGETYAITYNPNQRWYYFPKMQPDEAVLIRCFDSARSGPARFSAHGAFDDPQTPADAPPRESIEVRTLVFY